MYFLFSAFISLSLLQVNSGKNELMKTSIRYLRLKRSLLQSPNNLQAPYFYVPYRSPSQKDCKHSDCRTPDSVIDWHKISRSQDRKCGQHVKCSTIFCCNEKTIESNVMRRLTKLFVDQPMQKLIIPKTCGVQPPDFTIPNTYPRMQPLFRSKRIVSGVSSSSSSHGWMAALYLKGVFNCGATIISERVLVTAAHCLLARDVHSYEVITGSKRMGSGTAYSVLKIIKHPKYKSKSVTHDIAIVITRRAITFNEKVFPICLPPKTDRIDMEGMTATMTGFGRYYSGKDCDLRPYISIII